jgi:phosphoesterase RecJ-like protein
MAKSLIEGSRNILITPHANVDPDGLSAALACYLLFSDLGKECTVLCPDTQPQSLSFLPGYEKLEGELKAARDFIIILDCSRGLEVDHLRYTVEENKVNIMVTPKQGSFRDTDVTLREGGFPYDLIVVVDTAELPLLGSVYHRHREFFEQVPILNIDHHVSNAKFGKVQLLATDAASTTEALFAWFSSQPEWKGRITPDIATLLLTGLITDTRSFQNPNTTPRSLEVAAMLFDLGARQQEIIKFIYKTKPLSTLKLWGRALNRIQVNPKERIVWSLISKEDLAEMRASSKETHGIIDELLTTVPESDVFILFTEVEEGGLKASLRSTEAVDVSRLAARTYGGGGHPRAAGFRVRSYENFQLQVLECITKITEEMRRQRTQKPTVDIVSSLSAPALPPEKPGAIDVMREITAYNDHQSTYERTARRPSRPAASAEGAEEAAESEPSYGEGAAGADREAHGPRGTGSGGPPEL